MQIVPRVLLMGIGATLSMDLWAISLEVAFGIPSLDLGLLGRWLGRMPAGVFANHDIAHAPPVPAERLIGNIAHYGIGTGFAFLMFGICGEPWIRKPSLPRALTFGVATVAGPFFVMQPALGMGVAGSKTAKPQATRARSLATHAIFGIGLYLSATLLERMP